MFGDAVCVLLAVSVGAAANVNVVDAVVGGGNAGGSDHQPMLDLSRMITTNTTNASFTYSSTPCRQVIVRCRSRSFDPGSFGVED